MCPTLRTMTPLILLILEVSGAYCGSHTLHYYYTAVSDTSSGLPEFSVYGFLDDKQFMNYNSETHLARPVIGWAAEKEAPDYWEELTNIFRGQEPVFKHNVRTGMTRFNQTQGLHTVQWLVGCELGDDGSTAGYMHDGYDGRDYMYLDTKRGVYIPGVYEAQLTSQRLNSPEMRVGEGWKNYLDNICIQSLRKYIEYGREDLERRELPEVKVWGHQSAEVTRLHCLVYGFHPRDVVVKWVKNGVDDVPSDETSPILPHPDGTYQTRVSVEVLTREGDTYCCHVDHSSLEEIFIVNWEADNGLKTCWIAGSISCLIAAVLIIGVFLYRKINGGYRRPSSTDHHPAPVQPEQRVTAVWEFREN